jgi:hypothetical protein
MKVVLWNGQEDFGYLQPANQNGLVFGSLETAKRFNYNGFAEIILEAFAESNNLCIVEVEA